MTCDRRNFLGMMCGAAVMPPKEFLRAFEPKLFPVLAEWVPDSPKRTLKLTNMMDTPVLVEISISRVSGKVGEVTLTVNGEKSIIESEWEASPTT